MAGKIISNVIEGLRALQQRQYNFVIEQTFTLMQGKMAERLQAEVASAAARFDGTKISTIESKVQHLADLKTAALEKLASVKKGLADIVDARAFLDQMREAALAGNASAFDTAQSLLDTQITSATLDSSDLVGQFDYGIVGRRTISVDLGDQGSAHFETQSIGSRYRLTISGAAGGEPNLAAQTLRIDGVDVPFASLAFVSRTGDQVQFTDGVTTYTATLTPGGIGVASSWIYEHLSTPAGQAQAAADIDAATTRLSQLENGFRAAEAQIESAGKSLQTSLSILGDQVDTLIQTELSERGALVKAAQARFDAGVFQAAIMGQNQRARIEIMFEQPKIYEKDLFDVLSGR